MSVASDARRDLIRKMELEKKLVRQLAIIDNQIVKNTIRTLAESGNTFVVGTLQEDLAEVLNTHYEKTADVFADQISQILPSDIAITEAEKTLVDQALVSYYAARATEQSKIITATNQKDVDDAIRGARETRDEAGQPLTQRDQAREAGARTARKLKGREQGRATTETQNASETAKATEAEVLSGRQPSVLAGSPLVAGVSKEWVTVGDEKVRADHVNADSQVWDLSKPFRVGGQLLRWPGDTSLGASVGNVINCRCASVYDVAEIFAERRRSGFAPVFETVPSAQLLVSIGL